MRPTSLRQTSFLDTGRMYSISKVVFLYTRIQDVWCIRDSISGAASGCTHRLSRLARARGSWSVVHVVVARRARTHSKALSQSPPHTRPQM